MRVASPANGRQRGAVPLPSGSARPCNRAGRLAAKGRPRAGAAVPQEAPDDATPERQRAPEGAPR
jgi:hypothetical protein